MTGRRASRRAGRRCDPAQAESRATASADLRSAGSDRRWCPRCANPPVPPGPRACHEPAPIPVRGRAGAAAPRRHRKRPAAHCPRRCANAVSTRRNGRLRAPPYRPPHRASTPPADDCGEQGRPPSPPQGPWHAPRCDPTSGHRRPGARGAPGRNGRERRSQGPISAL